MTRQQLSYLLPVLFQFCISCGAVPDPADASDSTTTAMDSGSDSETIADTGATSTDDPADFTPDGLAVVKYVTLANPNLDADVTARFAMNGDDAISASEPGCKSLPYSYDVTGPRAFCFSRPKRSRSIRYMSLVNSDGYEVLRLYAGAKCHTQDVRAGNYEV